MSDYQYCPDRHEDTVALVTGSTHGIGLGTVKRLAREGASVVVNDEGARDGAAVASALRTLGGDALFVEGDAGDPGAIERLVDRTVEAFGRIEAAGFIDGAVLPVDGGRSVVLEEDRYADWCDDRA